MTQAMVTATRWQERSRCRQFPALKFNSDDLAEQAVAAVVCEDCPVLRDCLRFAVDSNSWDGVYGGLTSAERRELYVREYQSYMWVPERPNTLTDRILELLSFDAVVEANGHAVDKLTRQLFQRWPAGGSNWTRFQRSVERAVWRLRERGLINVQGADYGTVAIWSSANGAPKPQWSSVTVSKRAAQPRVAATPIVGEVTVRHLQPVAIAVKALPMITAVLPVVAEPVTVPEVPAGNPRPLGERILVRLAVSGVAVNNRALEVLAAEVGAPLSTVTVTVRRLRSMGYLDDDGDRYSSVNSIWLLPAGRRLIGPIEP
ncbi:WhiB family transcriptional regulator [Candidatus Saccharibacteria bacterium]|nr:WhiB family transcriptional regulator [Candidatus Saccharibacteria bacterium]